MSPSHPAPALDPTGLRAREFPFTRDAVYLNAASVGPLPERARRAVEAYHLRRSRPHEMDDADYSAPLRRSRAAAARLVGASPAEIALGWNTSFGINLAALSLPVEPGTTIVVSDREFPANVYPWMHRPGTRLEVVPARPDGNPDEERLLERLGRGDVSVFALSHVQFATGYRADLERFGRVCRERGIWFVVDAIQSLGQVPVDVERDRIDVLAAGGHKWLCSPFGTGFAYVRGDLAERMEPRVVGWLSMRASAHVEHLLDYRWEPREGARRFEVATLPLQDFAGFAEALELILEAGVEAIERHVARTVEPLLAWLREAPEVAVASDLTPGRRSGIVAFRPPGADAAFRRLREAGVACALREGAIRVSPHLYNVPEEMERVIGILEQSRAERWS